MKSLLKISALLLILTATSSWAQENAHFVGFRATVDPGRPTVGKLSYGTAIQVDGKLYNFSYLNVGEGQSSVVVEAAMLWPVAPGVKLGLVAGTGAEWTGEDDPVTYGKGSAGGIATVRFGEESLWGSWLFAKREDDLKSSTFYYGRWNIGFGLFRRF